MTWHVLTSIWWYLSLKQYLAITGIVLILHEMLKSWMYLLPWWTSFEYVCFMGWWHTLWKLKLYLDRHSWLLVYHPFWKQHSNQPWIWSPRTLPNILSIVLVSTTCYEQSIFTASLVSTKHVSFYWLTWESDDSSFSCIALLELAPAQFKLFIDSVVWGFKHTMRDIADVGLQICGELIDNISRQDPAIAGAFYQSYYRSILQDIFFVLTDRDHKSGKYFMAASLTRDIWLIYDA